MVDARVGYTSVGLFFWLKNALRALHGSILYARMEPMSKKKLSKKVMPKRALPGSTSWGSLWRGVSKSLASKKFLATLGASLLAISQGNWEMVSYLVMVYMGAQGAVDVAGKFKR